MKKQIYIAIYSLLLCAGILVPQTNLLAQQGFHFGAAGGGGTSFIIDENLTGRDKYVFAPKGAYMYGFQGGYMITDNIGFKSELNYTRQGQNYTSLQNVNNLRNLTLNYMQIPVMLTVSGGNYSSRFIMDIGLYYGYLSNARLTSIGEGGTTTAINALNMFNRRDFGISGGFGSNFNLKKPLYASIMLRFTYGLTDLNKVGSQYLDGSGNVLMSRNAIASLNFGLHYLLKTKKESKSDRDGIIDKW